MTATAVPTTTAAGTTTTASATTTRRPRRRLFARLGLVLAAGAVILAATGCDVKEQQFIDWTNQTRTDKGLAPLEGNMQLWLKAGAWAQQMGQENNLHHSVLTDKITADWRKLGENVGKGGDLRAIYDALLRSPGHYANIVDSQFDYIGVGIYFDGTNYWVAQEFMAV